ncbi:septum formation protein Maf [Winogradskyella echinorum]|uniref:dTTP/UTP pyrophosphatase n=1 Tax=Winogradskyella echinorum TaxID=538189 RepID=A0ABR6Y1Q9_9FLAO|nr:Maf family nucleotide pyrophosphatase [Winogradskyella echinorum]MBC3846687.1 septum formation protein Maf [Winogradskyella echinorum]MBC5751035.1 septum formation protein Maf [Winogradskyella echinorum]
MLNDKLKNFNIILASASPRRHAFLKAMNLDFEIQLKPVDEIYPEFLKSYEITDYLAKLKAEPFIENLQSNDILITSDTIVWHNEKAIGKPKDEDDAFNMIKSLSNSTHEVVTSICFTQISKQSIVNTITKVIFKALSDEEIWYYVKNYKPLDKAGAYGIQEWIGAIGITSVEGSYNNVVGLPTHLLYKTLNAIANGN